MLNKKLMLFFCVMILLLSGVYLWLQSGKEFEASLPSKHGSRAEIKGATRSPQPPASDLSSPQPSQSPPTAGEDPILETEMTMASLRREGRFLLGRVVNLSGQGIPRARVSAHAKDGSPPYFAVTRDDGEFYIMAPPGKNYTLSVHSAGLPELTLEVPKE